MSNLADAIQDVKAEVLKGKTAIEVIPEIAKDYGIKAELLNRKFAESFPNGVVEITSGQATAEAAKLQRAINHACLHYGVDPATRKTATTKMGQKVTVIGQRSTGSIIFIKHTDAGMYRAYPSYLTIDP